MFIRSTTIYHVTYYTSNESIYIFFLNCNFNCRGCIRNLTCWDTHLPRKTLNKLSELSPIKGLLTLKDLHRLILGVKWKNSLKRVILGGGEPTTDRKLIEVLDLMNKLELNVELLTNGYEIDDQLLNKLSDIQSNVTVSIKAINPLKHLDYTGAQVDRVLDNFKKMYEKGLNLSVETVLIPDLIGDDEIDEIAKFISNFDSSIPLRIDPYIPVPNSPWRKPGKREIEASVNKAKRHLKEAWTLHIDLKPIGNIICLWPRFN